MKLVDIDDDNVTHQVIESTYQTLPSDYNFTAPRVLSILDNSMSEILNCRDMDDSEKWILYNQTLQKFLNYMKKTRTPITQHTQRNHTIEAFDGHISDHNITGIQPLRDSIEFISQPNVRDFFQQIREKPPSVDQTHQSSPVALNLPTPSNFNNLCNTPLQVSQSAKKSTTPKKINPKSRQHRKRGAEHDVSGVLPPKIPSKKPTPRALFRSRRTAGHRHDFYWESTNSK